MSEDSSEEDGETLSSVIKNNTVSKPFNPFSSIHDSCHLLPHLLMCFDSLYYKPYE